MPTTNATALRTCRILYYGPAGCGKRENLAKIQASLPAEHRLAVATHDPARQIAFLLRNGNQGDWQVFVQALDAAEEPPIVSGSPVPFDGVVFVCDSRLGGLDEGLSAMEGLKSYLDNWRLDIMAMPMVLQYNLRDGDGVLPVDRMESLLNPWGLLSFPAASASGEGVRETLKAILSLTISAVLQRQPPAADADDARELLVDTGPPVPGSPYTPERSPRTLSPGSGQQGETGQRATAASAVAGDPGSSAGSRSQATAEAGVLVIPVRIPRRLLGADGTGRILLEVHVTDD